MIFACAGVASRPTRSSLDRGLPGLGRLPSAFLTPDRDRRAELFRQLAPCSAARPELVTLELKHPRSGRR